MKKKIATSITAVFLSAATIFTFAAIWAPPGRLSGHLGLTALVCGMIGFLSFLAIIDPS